MAKDIVFPSVTEIYGALITPTGPRAYVPKLSRAINKMVDEPTADNLARAKKITKNPVIQQTIDAIYTATKSSRYDDDIMDIQYGIIATLVDNEYTQLPWLVDKIKDDEIQYQVLNNYREKYAGVGYAQQYYAQPINQRTDKDYLSKCIIEIYLSLIMHPKTPTVRKDGEHRAIYQISEEFINKIQQNSHLHKEVVSSYQEILNRIEKIINSAMKTPRSSYNRESEYATLAIHLTKFIPDTVESKRLHDHFTKLAQKCMFPHVFQEGEKPEKEPEQKPKKKKGYDWRDAKEIELDTPAEQPDAYDRLKQKFGRAIKRVKKKTGEISEKPGVKKARKQAGDALESAARATVNAIDAGIEKIKEKATRENFESAIDSIKKKFEEFMAQIETQKKKKTKE